MADKQKPGAEKPKAVTFYGCREGKRYEVWRVEVHGDKVTRKRVVDHTVRAVAAERLRILLMGPEVML